MPGMNCTTGASPSKADDEMSWQVSWLLRVGQALACHMPSQIVTIQWTSIWSYSCGAALESNEIPFSLHVGVASGVKHHDPNDNELLRIYNILPLVFCCSAMYLCAVVQSSYSRRRPAPDRLQREKFNLCRYRHDYSYPIPHDCIRFACRCFFACSGECDSTDFTNFSRARHLP